MSWMHGQIRQTFSALSVRNYRLFFIGQLISVSGTWMQSVGQAWLVLRLTGSGTALGSIIALQTIPVLLGGLFGGVIADRFSKRTLLLVTQSSAATLALTLGLLTQFGAVRLWMVGVLAFGLGCVNALDVPTRQAFVVEMVGRSHLTNAITLNSVIMNGARVVGPAVAGAIIATAGIAPCFLINAGSYLAVITGLALIDPVRLRPVQRAPRTPGQLRAGLRYVWDTPSLRTPLLMMAVVGAFAYEFQVTLPLLARFTFDTGAQGFGALSSVMGAGAVAGGLVTAARARSSARLLGISTLLFGTLIFITSLAPTFTVALALIALTGAASIFFSAMTNTTVQLNSRPEMRGRVMSLYAIAFMGTTPIGGPIIGWIGESTNPRLALAAGGLCAVAAVLVAWRSLMQPSGRRGAVPGDSLTAVPAETETVLREKAAV